MLATRNEIWRFIVKSSIIKLALTHGTRVTALLAGAATFRIG
jgi:hypothetical protein